MNMQIDESGRDISSFSIEDLFYSIYIDSVGNSDNIMIKEKC